MSDDMVSAETAGELLKKVNLDLLTGRPWTEMHTSDVQRFARTVVALHERLAAVEAERDALRAIVEGRTTPPTAADLAVHAAHGGLWRTRYTLGHPALVADCVDSDVAERVRDAQAATGGVYLWWALDSHGRPCAWPGDEP